MKAPLVRIGNSHGVRIPKTVIEQCGFKGQVEMTVRDRTVVISASRRAREGWDAAFKVMAEAGDDAALLPDAVGSHWDESEWRW
ncbi:MAG: AbrB/MazE/SpoVT family DNA-binding domain-containing protein [Alphaproteobacteria bacterium]|nr:AbrB/MazE/SpoVT family DNA-binding domain-containing protein [Alphaproteobacteria bacterium]